MNRDGFAAFAKREPASRILVSPLLSWYIRRALAPHGPDSSDQGVLDRLRHTGVTISGAIRARRGASGYTETVASLERTRLGIATVWTDAPDDAESAWVFDAAIEAGSGLVTQTSGIGGIDVMRAPFFSESELRGVRFDTENGSQALYIFWSSLAELDRLRAELSPALWRAMSGRFTPADVIVSNLAVTVADRDATPLENDDGFGSFRPPNWPRNGDAVLRFSTTRNEMHVRIDARATGLSTNPRVAPTPRPPALLDPVPIPREQQIYAAVPALYVVEDTVTGAILLLGEND